MLLVSQSLLHQVGSSLHHDCQLIVIVCLFISGDDGAADFPARDDPNLCGYVPDFPSACPYVVAVGGTQGPESNRPEIVCSSSTGGVITSGGSLVFIYVNVVV